MPDLRSSPAALAQAVEEAAGLYRQRRLDEADRICTRVLKANPQWFDALHLQGLIKLQNGKPGAALGFLEAALKINPASPEVMANLAMALSTLNRDAEALALIDRALARSPGSVDALNGRGNVLLKLDRPTEALAAFERVIAIEPRVFGAHLNRGGALAALGRFEEALAQFDAVLAVMPGHAEIHVNRGNALSSLGRSAEAVAAFDRALAIRPDYLNALIGRGAALQRLNRHREALADFDRAAAIDKNSADAHHNAGLALLTLGDYRRGFAEYEWRWQRTGMGGRRSLGKPLWLGEYPLSRKTILLHGEQGLGDCIQFARYVPMLARAGAKVVLEVPRELVALLSRIEGVAAVVARGEALPAYDVHCPLGSLPLALRTELSTVPADVPYLKATAKRIDAWRARIAALAPPRVAIAWAGSALHVNDRNRSIALERLAPLFALDASFVSIQRELREADGPALARVARLLHVGGELADFDDTAAVVSLVDLVISVDTSVVHLAGALGRPTWILVPFVPDWRWTLDGALTPWYPTARLFRQPAAGDWDSVIAAVQNALAEGYAPSSVAPPRP